MTSDEIKADIVHFCGGCGLKDTSVKDWKRTSKKSFYDGTASLRTFANDKVGVQVLTLEENEGEDLTIIEGGTMLFYAVDADSEMREEGIEGIFVMFASETFWKRTHYIPDNHMQWFMENCYSVREDLLDELSENQFIINEMGLEEVKEYLTGLGMKYEDMSHAGSM